MISLQQTIHKRGLEQCQKEEILLILGVIIANLIVVIVLKNHGELLGRSRTLPSQAEVKEKVAR